MITATIEMWFCAAHRIEGHPKCGRLHGHNYKIQVTVARPAHKALGIGDVDDMGFIIDFGVLKTFVKEATEVLDHKYMVSKANIAANDPYYIAAIDDERDEDVVTLAIVQTSVELLAIWFKNAIQQLLADNGMLDIAVMEVRLWETNKSFATC